jgi:putative endopeptidase
MRSKLSLLLLLVSCFTFAQDKTPDPNSPNWPLPKLDHFDLGLVDKSLNPCDNLYKFVCSKWLAANPIPADQPAWGTSFSSNLQLYNETILRNALQEAAIAKDRDQLHEQIGDYWNACMDETAIEKNGAKPIQPDLDFISSIKSKDELPEAVARLHHNNSGAWQGDDNETNVALFGFGPAIDFKQSSLVVAGFDQGGMGMPGRDYYLSTDAKMAETRQKYEDHIRKLFTLAGEKPEQAAADAKTVLRIETAMAKSAMDNVKRRDPANLNNPMPLDQFRKLAPSFDFVRYLKLMDAPTPQHYIVTSPDYFRGLEQLLKSEPLDAWKTYLRWWAIHKNARYLSKAFVDEDFDFNDRVLFGLQENEPRWRRCVGWADRDLGEAVGRAYVDKAFPPENKQRVLNMVNAIEDALGADIKTLDWMSPETKKQAQEKLSAIYDKIGYPKTWRDYSSVKIVPDDLVANIRQATHFELNRQLNKVGKPVDREEFTMTPPTINAYYDPQMNTINFPAGILQPPFFDAALEDAVNYGAIGLVIGHEISHGFDDQGRKFDANGNLRDWWTSEDGKKYDERAACISQEYTHDVPELGVKTNGQLTLGEDSADNAGLRIAMLALEDTYKKQGKDVDAKDADGWTPRQKFFLSHAFSWCENDRPEFARLVVTTNPHSLSEYRVNYVEKNSPDFQKAFGCKAGHSMVSANACRVW